MIIPDMSDVDYHARSEFSSTQARQVLDSPARYKWHLDHPREATAAFDVGTAAHSKILGVGAGVVAYPEEHLTGSGNVSTKAATVAWAEDQRVAGLTPVSPSQMDAVDAMAESVLAHPIARGLLEQPGIPEASVFATDPHTGVDLRARFDYLAEPRPSGARTAVDLKTTAGAASEHGFAQSAAKYGYEIQRAHYLQTLTFSTGERDTEMLFIVVEKAPPYLVAVHQLETEFSEMGEVKAEHSRRVLAECREADTWPGYPVEIGNLKPPMWMVYDYQDRFGGIEEIQV